MSSGQMLKGHILLNCGKEITKQCEHLMTFLIPYLFFPYINILFILALYTSRATCIGHQSIILNAITNNVLLQDTLQSENTASIVQHAQLYV